MGAKTNAMRQLDAKRIRYAQREYPVGEALDAVSVAQSLGEPAGRVFKTLVTVADDRAHLVFCIPGDQELDLKKCARAAGKRAVAMIPQKELLPLTGYIHGGCSPIGMKKNFPTLIDESAAQYPTIFVSGGKIGLQIEIDPQELLRLTGARLADLTRK